MTCATSLRPHSFSQTGSVRFRIPTVQRFAPKLLRTIDRAADYTKSVIDYGKAVEAPPKRRSLLLKNLIEDVAEVLALGK